MERFAEISIDLTAQELADPATQASPIEVDDIGEFDTLPEPLAAPIQAQTQPQEAGPDDDTVEIELTTEQMESMLKALPKR